MRPNKRAGNLGVGNDPLAVGEVVPQLAHEGAVVAVVEGTEHGADRVGGFFSVVEGDATAFMSVSGDISTTTSNPGKLGGNEGVMDDLREQVVNNVVVDNVVEEVLANEAKVAINGGESALDEGPAVGFEVVDFLVGVVEVGDGDCWHTVSVSN